MGILVTTEISDRYNFQCRVLPLHSVLNVHRYSTTNDFRLIITVFLLLTRKLTYFGCRECVSRRPLPLHLVFYV